MSESISDPPEVSTDPAAPMREPSCEPCEGPPPADRPAEPRDDPRSELLQMAATLARTRDDRLLAQYLRLRRAAG